MILGYYYQQNCWFIIVQSQNIMDNEELKGQIPYQTKHTDTNEEKPPRLSIGSDIQGLKVGTPMQRSTRAYYDSETDNNQNRSRKDSTRSRQLSLILKHPRVFRQELVFLHHPQEDREFFVYWVATKESNTGIFSHQRFFLIDSQNQQMKYYSDIPELPLKSLQELKSPKEIISLNKKHKIGFTANPSKIGRVSFSWYGPQGKKQWLLTLGSNKMVKQLGCLIESVRNNFYSGLREVKNKIDEVCLPKNKNIIKTQTKFISEIKELENKKVSLYSVNSSKLANPKDSQKSSFKTIQYKNLIKDSSGISQPFQKIYSKSLDQKTVSLRSSKKKVEKVQENNNKGGKLEIFQKKHPKPVQKYHEITLTQIIDSAHLQFQQLKEKSLKNEHLASIDPQPPRQFSSLEKIINKRKQTEIIPEPSVIDQTNTSLNMSKIHVSKIQSKELQTPKGNKQPLSPQGSLRRHKIFKPQSPKYNLLSSSINNENKYRQFLLQQRRKPFPSVKTNQKNHINPDISNSSQIVKSRSKLEQKKQWLALWFQASTAQQLASIYSAFVDHCIDFVYNMVDTMINQHYNHHPISNHYTTSQDFIDYTYFLFLQDEFSEAMIQKQQQMMKDYNSMNYLFTNLKKHNKPYLSFPLSCVVTLKGFNVFCTASVKSASILLQSKETIQKYRDDLIQCQKSVKVSLQRCECLQIVINNKEYLYLKRGDIFPTLPSGSYIDGKYIDQFVKEGIIRNVQDLEVIQNHLTQQLIPPILQEIQRDGLISRTQLLNLLGRYELNQSILYKLYSQSIQRNFSKASTLIRSEIVAQLLEEHIRQCIHGQIQKKNRNIQQLIFSQIRSFLKGNSQITLYMNWKLKNKIEKLQKMDITNIQDEYLLTSVFERLGIRTEIKYRMQLNKLEEEDTKFWRQVQFNRNNFKIEFFHSTVLYHYSSFNSNYSLLNKELFSLTDTLHFKSVKLTHQKVLSLLNNKQNEQYHQSPLFKLLTGDLKIKINYFLGHNSQIKMNMHFHPSPYDLFFNFLYHSTTFIVNSFDFEQDIIGIKMLINKKAYQKSSTKIEEQLHRVLIWTKYNINFLIQLYDIKSLLSLKMQQEKQSITYSLKALKLSIQLFNKREYVPWQTILDRALHAANVHYSFQKYEKALQFYENCEQLIEKASQQQLITQQINPQFIEVYHKKSLLNLLLCKIQGTMNVCSSNLKQYSYLEKLLENSNKQLVLKIKQLEFEAHLLILRCHQIQNKPTNILTKVGQCLSNYLERQMEVGLSALKGNEFKTYKLVELCKNAWIAILYNINDLTVGSYHPSINLISIQTQIQTFHHENSQTPRFTTQQMVKYISEVFLKLLSESSSTSQSNTIEGSVILAYLVKVLQEVSSSKTEQKTSIYEPNCLESTYLFFECFTDLISYSFARGILRIVNQEEIW